MVQEIQCKSALYKLKSKRFPYDYDLNLYKGCGHGCRYCYARCTYSKYHGEENNFQTDILVKKNIASVLDMELSKKDYTKSFINLGGVCDSYQPIERKYELMREVLPVLIKHNQPTMFSTKSDLLIRDMDLLNELSQVTRLIIGFCITTSDYEISKRIEPGASKPENRYKAMREVKKNTNATVGLHIFPIIPLLSDDGLETLFQWGKDGDVDYVLTAFMHLRGNIRGNVLPYIKRYFPGVYKEYLELYVKNSVSDDYKQSVNARIKGLRMKYGLNKFYPNYSLESSKENLKLF
jgi:DNA repair photolyase